MSNALRFLAKTSRTASGSLARPAVISTRSFHTPFAMLGNSPLTSPPPPLSTAKPIYEKETDYSTDFIPGTRTYVVSEPVSSHVSGVPLGAFPTSAPYVNFAATEAPNTTAQYSSTASGHLAHPITRSAVQHEGGVGQSAAVRNSEAPGEMGRAGGSSGGLGLMDKKGTHFGEGELAERNPPPIGETGEKFSKLGLENAWKARK